MYSKAQLKIISREKRKTAKKYKTKQPRPASRAALKKRALLRRREWMKEYMRKRRLNEA